METNENLTQKLQYIGLDLNNVPERLNYLQSINFRIHKNYNEKNYKKYQFINVDDIEIFLTPTNRITDYTEKCAKALPLGAYLNSNTEQDLERNVEFLKLIKELEISDLQFLEEQQKSLNKSIPYSVTFAKDYLWQIYYSDISKKYFMLTPIRENDCSALFYLIKKQIEGKNPKIYVPICYASYTNTFLDKQQIEEIEKDLCFFAKDWPLIYEVYDKENVMKMEIFGKALIYDTIKSEYKISLQNQGVAEDFYKLIKALFILQTQLSYHYNFKIMLDRKGMVHFLHNNTEIIYENLISFIKQEYIKGLEKLIKAKETNINLDKKLKSLKTFSKELDNEYYEKERQISTFLECKKTFFGRVKYFIKYKKVNIQKLPKAAIAKEEIGTLKYCERAEIKDSYTIEELLALYNVLDKETSSIKDFELDIDAINKRIDILKTKIKNANQYIKEIDEHKKSIFEFWKFTNKDEAKQLNEGVAIEHKTKKLQKTFNYELDFEDLSKLMDKKARELFTKDETDNIFAVVERLNDINLVINKQKISEACLEDIKKQMLEKNKTVSFDIFGSTITSNDNVKTLGNIRHRENEKNIYSVLELTESNTVQEYTNKLKQIEKSVSECYERYKNLIEMSIYKVRRARRWIQYFLCKSRKCFTTCRRKGNKFI